MLCSSYLELIQEERYVIESMKKVDDKSSDTNILPSKLKSSEQKQGKKWNEASRRRADSKRSSSCESLTYRRRRLQVRGGVNLRRRDVLLPQRLSPIPHLFFSRTYCPLASKACQETSYKRGQNTKEETSIVLLNATVSTIWRQHKGDKIRQKETTNLKIELVQPKKQKDRQHPLNIIKSNTWPRHKK